jgi:phage terminase large subunit GpA-like protein
MIKGSPRLRGHMTGVDDDSSSLRINLQHMVIYIAWARSAARLANKAIRYLLFDEVDKYVDTAGRRETDPISLGEARTITYRFNRKIWKISTPTTETGNISKAMTTEAQLVFDYWVRCPSCDADQKMEFKQIRWPRTAEPGTDGKLHSEDPAVIENDKLAWYECPHCLAAWNDYERDAAVRAGGWRDRASGLKLFEALRARRPMKIGFHLPSWISPFVSLSEIAASFLSSRGDRIKDRDFHNKHLAEPWTNLVTTTDREKILAAKCPLPAQTVPEEAVELTVGVDVQKAGFWFVVRAWSREGRSWLVHYGFLATWEEVETLIFATSYPVGDTGRSKRPFRALIDTGGGSKYEDMTMTEETYLWIIRNRGRGGVALWGSKGASAPMPTMLKMGGEILHTSSGKKLPAAFKPIFIDTVKAKDQFHERIQKAADPETRALPDAAFLHAGTGDDYVAQIMAEEKKLNEKGREEWVNVGHRANHLLDAEILAAACVEMEFPGGGLRLRAEQLKALEARRQAVAKAPAATEARDTVGGYQRPGWLNR